MKQLSYWAKRHPLQARAVIAAAHIFAMTLAFVSGIWLYACYHIAWPAWIFPTVLAFTAWVRSTYPARRTQSATPAAADRYYWRTRRTIAGATACAWLLVLVLGNHAAQQSEQPDKAQRAISERSIPTACSQMPLLMIESSKPAQVKTTFKWLKIKQKTFFKKQVHFIRRHTARGGEGSMDPMAQVLLTLLVFIVAAFLEFLVLIMACNLSCSGQEAAALLVGLLGTGLIVWGMVAAIIAIWRKPDGQDMPPGSPAPARRPPSKKL